MATFTARTLSAGALPSIPNTVYSVAAGLKSYVKNFWLYNDSAIEQTIILSLTIDGTTRVWRRIVLDALEGASVLEGEEALVLSAGNAIQAESTTSAVVNYSLHGVEETA